MGEKRGVVILRFAQDDSAACRRDEWEKGRPTLSTERGKGGAPLKFWDVPTKENPRRRHTEIDRQRIFMGHTLGRKVLTRRE